MPYMQLGPTGGYNLGVSLPRGSLFSSAALTGDAVLRTLTDTNLIFQSGSSTYGIFINSNNDAPYKSSSIHGTLNVSSTTILNNATTVLSSLNVVRNIIGSGTALTNLKYGAITK
jgi:hypothetical protein